MKIETQLWSFLAFFIFGFALTLTDTLFLMKHRKLCYPVFTSLTLIFMFIIYHINGGYVHIYFLMSFIVGIFTSKISVKYIDFLLHLLKAKCKR